MPIDLIMINIQANEDKFGAIMYPMASRNHRLHVSSGNINAQPFRVDNKRYSYMIYITTENYDRVEKCVLSTNFVYYYWICYKHWITFMYKNVNIMADITRQNDTVKGCAVIRSLLFMFIYFSAHSITRQ